MSVSGSGGFEGSTTLFTIIREEFKIWGLGGERPKPSLSSAAKKKPQHKQSHLASLSAFVSVSVSVSLSRALSLSLSLKAYNPSIRIPVVSSV